MSIESPYATPWVATITGYRQRSRAEMECWNDVIVFWSSSAFLAASTSSVNLRAATGEWGVKSDSVVYGAEDGPTINTSAEELWEGRGKHYGTY